jgi:MerR family transcriptional regulator, light-induced transcriptional regulator
MGKYSIKELEQLSGIKAHTIRIWEKRHKIIVPSRTPTNIRTYSDDDLKKIINVSLLNNYGIKISKIAKMSPADMNERILQIAEVKNDASVHIDQLIVAMMDIDEEGFEKILGNLILRYGFERAVTEIVYPFLERIGILWQTHNITPAHEHFISNLIRQKIIVAIDSLAIPPKTSKKVMLFLPEHEMHELGLLFYHYLARKAGLRTYYLGQSVPHADLVSIFAAHLPDVLLTSVTSTLTGPIADYIEQLATDFPAIPILMSGIQVREYKGSKIKNVQTFTSALDLLKYL